MTDITEVRLPPDPLFTEEGTHLLRWLIPSGRYVRAGDLICEIENSTLTAQLPAPVAGLLEVIIEAGQVIPNQAVLATIIHGGATLDGRKAESLFTMNPYEFEALMADLCRALGLVCEVTKKSGDGGVDIIARSAEPIVGGIYVVQCKRYAGKVPIEMIRDLYGVTMHQQANKGILITTAEFTSAGYDFARNKTIELINGQTLITLLQKFKLL